MIQKTTLILFMIISLFSSANAATRYVGDDLYTYIHAGPGTKYKIIGSVNAGEKIELIQTDTNAGFSEIKDQKGRSGWINSQYISRQVGLKERLEKLEIEFSTVNQNLENLQVKLNSSATQVTELKNTNSKLNEELQQLQVLNTDLNEKLDTEKTDLLMRWFSYGGIVGGIGLLLGLILPSLIPSTKKRNRW